MMSLTATFAANQNKQLLVAETTGWRRLRPCALYFHCFGTVPNSSSVSTISLDFAKFGGI